MVNWKIFLAKQYFFLAEAKTKAAEAKVEKAETEALKAKASGPAALGKTGGSSAGGKVLPKEEVSADVLNMLKVRRIEVTESLLWLSLCSPSFSPFPLLSQKYN